LVGEFVKVTTIVVIEKNLACLDTMGEVGIVRANVVTDLDHDINSSILDMSAATAALQASARLVTLVKLALPGVNWIDD
jgi:hypothetical protein